MNLRSILNPLLRGEPEHWGGLPPVTVSDVEALFGPALETSESPLGYHRATRRVHRLPSPEEGQLIVWARGAEVVMVESPALPSVYVLDRLPPPSAVLAGELFLPDAHARELLYCGPGLVLTVARPHQRDTPERVVRCRGIKPLKGPEEFDTSYHKALDDQISWPE